MRDEGDADGGTAGDAASATPAILRDEGDAADETDDDGVPLLLGFGVMVLLLLLGVLVLRWRDVQGCELAGHLYFKCCRDWRKSSRRGKKRGRISPSMVEHMAKSSRWKVACAKSLLRLVQDRESLHGGGGNIGYGARCGE